MSLIPCPECGTSISDKAVTCPYCGFRSKKVSLPISMQDKYTPSPIFTYDITEWNPNRGDLPELSIEDNKQLYMFFGKMKNLKNSLPALAETIMAMAKKETYLVADYDEYIADLIKKGVYRFSIDKNGEILPTIRDAKKIVKQVRLKEMNFTPQLNQSLNNIAVHAQLAQIMDEIEYIGDAIRNVHIELQNDRIAMAESALDRLKQARMIRDSRLREIAIIEAIGAATDAKRVLMRNFTDNRVFLEDRTSKSTIKMALDYKGEKDAPIRASDAFQDIISITNSVQVECQGYAMLGEYDSCKECLIEFRDFVVVNKLDKRDTLLRLNENLKMKNIDLVDQFSDITKKVGELNIDIAIDYNAIYLEEDD